MTPPGQLRTPHDSPGHSSIAQDAPRTSQDTAGHHQDTPAQLRTPPGQPRTPWDTPGHPGTLHHSPGHPQDSPGHPMTAQNILGQPRTPPGQLRTPPGYPRTAQDKHIQHTRTKSPGPSASPPHLCSLRHCVSTTAAEKLLPFHTQASSLLKLTNRN